VAGGHREEREHAQQQPLKPPRLGWSPGDRWIVNSLIEAAKTCAWYP
jgi:hypothetical protein